MRASVQVLSVQISETERVGRCGVEINLRKVDTEILYGKTICVFRSLALN